MKDQKKAYIYALLAVTMWSTVATAFKIALRYVTPLELLLYASFVSTILLFFIILVQNKFNQLRDYSAKQWLHSLLLGALNPFFYYIVLFEAYDILLAQEAQTLNYTWGITIAILSVPFLKQKMKLRSLIAIFISFFGVIIISTRGRLHSLEFSNPYGVALAVGSSLVWAFFWIFNLKDDRDEVLKLFLNFSFGFVFIFIANLFFGRLQLPNWRGILAVSYVGIFEMGITFVVWLKALQFSQTTSKVSNLIFLSPFLSLVFINVILGEKIYISSVIGLFFIILGIILQNYRNKIPTEL
ncbi:MAG: DMT family transporter [Candidatus Cloacimonadota bacterium]|nr:DMT family transporter [Candidatus Cloacimonadota bacterium]